MGHVQNPRESPTIPLSLSSAFPYQWFPQPVGSKPLASEASRVVLTAACCIAYSANPGRYCQWTPVLSQACRSTARSYECESSSAPAVALFPSASPSADGIRATLPRMSQAARSAPAGRVVPARHFALSPWPRFPTVLRTLRKGRGFTQDQLGRRTPGVSAGFIALLETGRRRPSLDTLKALSDSLDCTSEERNWLLDALQEDESTLGAVRSESSPGELGHDAVPSLDPDMCNRIMAGDPGATSLDRQDYFQEIIHALWSTPPRRTVYAVNSIDTRRWIEDPRERAYLEANRRAVARRVAIRRIFILRESDPVSVLDDQNAHGIDVLKVPRDQVSHLPELIDDWVLFPTEEPTLYIDAHDPDDPTRVMMGWRTRSQPVVEQYRRNFDLLARLAEPHLVEGTTL